MKSIPFTVLAKAAPHREPGYLDAVLAAGRRDGDMLLLDDDAYLDLARRFRPPDLAAQAMALVHASAQWAGAGFAIVTQEQEQERKRICAGNSETKACAFWNPGAFLGSGNCKVCGCGRIKLKWATERCPIGKWAAVNNGKT